MVFDDRGVELDLSVQPLCGICVIIRFTAAKTFHSQSQQQHQQLGSIITVM